MTGSEAFELFQDYYICLAAIGILMYLCTSNRIFSNWVHRCFQLGILAVLLLVIAEFHDRYFAYYPDCGTQRAIASCLGYILKPWIGYSMVQISMRKWKLRWRLLNMTPAAVNTVLCVVSIFNGIVFSFGTENVFVRGQLGFVPFVAGGFYLVELVAIGIGKGRKRDVLEAVICVYTSMICIAAVIFETVTSTRGLLPNALIMAIAFYYIYFLVDRYSRDPLTGLFLRQRFYYDTDRIARPTYIVTMDMNGLKAINDQYGHASGDKTLTAFADVLSYCLPYKAKAYRLGGDEFAVLYPADGADDIEKYLGVLRLLAKKQGLSFSAGYSLLSSKEEFDKAFEIADTMMYEEKRQFHAASEAR